MRRRPCHPLVCTVVLLGATAFAATSAVSPDAVRRTLALLGGAAGEYAEAFDASGQLVRPIELEEASLLLAEARDVVEHLDPAARAAVAPTVEAFAKGLSGRLPTTQVDALSAAARQALSDATGVLEDTKPPAPPSVARGKAVYLDNCARCHGDAGAGDGPDAAALDHRPAQFNDRRVHAR